MNSALKYAALTLASVVVFCGSFVIFAALSGAPMHEIALIGNWFEAPPPAPEEDPEGLTEELAACPDLVKIVLADGESASGRFTPWKDFVSAPAVARERGIDADMAAILYTSGSTGKPKGVVLSQRNMVGGAVSVAHYLKNTADDRILAVLPFSFDYGFSQLSTAFLTGAGVALIERAMNAPATVKPRVAAVERKPQILPNLPVGLDAPAPNKGP